MKINLIGLDIAKSIFHLVMVNQAGKFIKKKMLKRADVSPFFATLEPCIIIMEACGSAHHWARLLQEHGHIVKLIAPQYVKPFVQGNKNDYNDAMGIAEAGQRPNMRFVPIKTIAQHDIQMVHRLRERLVKNRTALVNQIRGLLAEYGIVIKKGVASVRSELPGILEAAENTLSIMARESFAVLYEELLELDNKHRACEKKIIEINRSHDVCKRLDEINGIGPVTATALYAAAGTAKEFENGRHFSAWLGLVPKQHSSGGKANLLGISKRGNGYLRTLLIHGARAVLKYAAGKDDKLSRWAISLLERRGHNKACVALANKLARMAWVIMAKGERYRLAV
jgi:transposase